MADYWSRRGNRKRRMSRKLADLIESNESLTAFAIRRDRDAKQMAKVAVVLFLLLVGTVLFFGVVR